MSQSNSTNEPVIKKGWLNVQLPGVQLFKQYYATLRLSTLDLYASPKDVPWVYERKITLENCIIVQAMKKGPVRHGFTLLLVPEGMYTLSASSESDKNSWVKMIRETISKQAKIGKQIIEKLNNPSNMPEKSNFVAPVRPMSSMGRECQRSNSLSRTPDRQLSFRNTGRDNRLNRESGFSKSSCGKLISNKPCLSTSDLRANRGSGSFLKVSSNFQAWDSRLPKEQRSQTQSVMPRGREGSLDTLSISSTDEAVKRKQVENNSFETHIRRPLPSVSENSQLYFEDNTPRVFRCGEENDESRDASSTNQRLTSKGLTSHVGLPKQTEKFMFMENGTIDNHRNESDMPRTFINSNDQYPHNQKHSKTRNQPKNGPLCPVNSTTNGVNYVGHNSTRQITILREPSEVRQSAILTSAEPHFRDPYVNEAVYNNPRISTSPKKAERFEEKQSKPQSKLQLGFFNFRQSSRRKRQSSASGRVVTIPSNSNRHTLVENDIENALLNENHLLRERIRILHQRNDELEKSFGRSQKTLETETVGFNEEKTLCSQNSRHLVTDEKVWIPAVTCGTPFLLPRPGSTIPPENMPAHQRVEEWLMGKSSTLPNNEDRKSFRRKLNKARRSTTEDIPSIRTLSPSPYICDDNMPLHIRRPQSRQNYQTPPDYNAYRKSPKFSRPSLEANEQNGPMKSFGDVRSMMSSTPLTSKVSTFAVTDASHPKYSSTMWCRLVELWSTLLNEERTFWRIQLESVLSQNANSQQDAMSPFSFTELLEKVNEKHSAETVMLWKHVYENWVPHEYMEYLTDEIRKGFLCLHSVIDALLNMLSQDATTPIFNKLLSDIKTEVKKINLSSQPNPLLTCSCQSEDRSRSCSIFEDKGQPHLQSQSSKVSKLSTEDLFRTKMLLRESHAQLLEQVYGVAELVGAALDTDMEDAMKAAKEDSTGSSMNPLRSIPGSGLHVAAKLQSIVLDLEARLAVNSFNSLTDSQYKMENNSEQVGGKNKTLTDCNEKRRFSAPITQNRKEEIPSHWSVDDTPGFNLMP